MGVRAHSTRGIASSWAWSSGVSIAEICAAAGRASPSTFARFYNLEVPALQARVLSAKRAHSCHMTNQYGRLPSSCTFLALNRAPRQDRLIWDDYSRPGRPLWVWLLPSAGLPCTKLGPSGSLLVPKENSSVGHSPSVGTVGLHWFP